MKGTPLKQAQQYSYNGKDFSIEEIQVAADSSGLSFDDYVSKHKLINDDFQTDPVNVEAVAGSEIQPINTASKLEKSLSDFKFRLTGDRDKNEVKRVDPQIKNVVQDSTNPNQYIKRIPKKIKTAETLEKDIFDDIVNPENIDFGVPGSEVAAAAAVKFEKLQKQGADFLRRISVRRLKNTNKSNILNAASSEEKVTTLLEVLKPSVNKEGVQDFSSTSFIGRVLGSDEEEAKITFDKIFSGTNLEFEEVNQGFKFKNPDNFAVLNAASGGTTGGFEFIKVKIPGSEGHVVLELNTDSLFTGQQTSALNKANYKLLQDYMTKNASLIKTDRDFFQNKESLRDEARAITEIATENNPIFIEEKQEIKSRFNVLNLDKSTAVNNTEFYKINQLFDGKYSTDRMPYSDETGSSHKRGVLADKFDAVSKELSALSDDRIDTLKEKYKAKTIDDLAKMMVLNQEAQTETLGLINKFSQLYIEDNFQSRDTAAALNVGTRMLDLDLNKELENITSTQSTILDKSKENKNIQQIIQDVIDQKGGMTQLQEEQLTIALNNNGIVIDPYDNETYSETTIDENGVETTTVFNKAILSNLKTLYDQAYMDNASYYSIFNTLNDKAQNIADKKNELNVSMDAASRNYDLSEKYISNIALGTLDIGAGIANLGFNVFTGGVYMDEESPFQDFYKTTNRVRGSYVRDVDFSSGAGGAFNSIGNFGKFLMQEGSNQLPILAAMVASGGYAALVVGASSTGQKQMDMTYQLVNGLKDHSHTSMWLTSLGYGLAEGGFAHLTTVPILARAKRNFLKSGKLKGMQALNTSSKNWAKENARGTVTDILLEPLGEIATVGVQNMLDGVDVTRGMDHAGFSGFGFGLLFSGLPFLRGAYNSKFSSYESMSEMRGLQNSINEMGSKLDRMNYGMGDINPNFFKTKKQLMDNMAKKQAKLNKLIESNTTLIQNTLGEEAIGATIFVRNKQFGIQNKIKDIKNNPDIDAATKQKLISDLVADFDIIESRLQDMLSDTNKKKLRTAFVGLEVTNKEKYDNFISEADANLIAKDPDKKHTPEDVKKEAYNLYMKDKFEATDAQAAAEGINISQFNTIDEAVAGVQALVDNGTLDEQVGADFIDGIKNNNADGAAYVDANGVKTTISVMENRIKNEQQFTKTHEIGHQVFWELFTGKGADRIGFGNVSNQLLTSMEMIDNKTYQSFIKDQRIYDGDGNVDPKEVISVFLEYIAQGKFGEKKAKGLSGLFGVLTQQKFKEKYKFDFKGETDSYNFVVNLAKKIQDGTLTKEDIADAKESSVVTDAQTNDIKDFINQTKEAPSDVANSAGTNLEGLLNDFVVGKMNIDRSKKGLPVLPEGFIPKPEKKREKIRSFVNGMLSTDVNGNQVTDFMKSRLVAESDAMGPYVTTISNKIWNGLDPMNREGQTIDTWKQLVATELSTMIQQEYLKPNKEGVTKFQDLDKFVRNRGYFRVFELAKATFKQTAATLGLENVGDVADTEVDLDAEQADLDAAKKLRDSKVDFVNKVKFIDSSNKAVNLPNSVVDAITNNIVKTFKTKKFKNELGTNKFRTELAKEYGGSIGTMFKNVMQRGENFNNDVELTNADKKGNYSQFLSQNFNLIYDLPIDVLNKKYPFLTESTGVRMNAEQIRGHNDAIDKGLSVGKKITDIKSGPFIFEKVKDKIKAKIDYLNYFEGTGVKPNTKGARQLSLADTMGQESAYDIQGDALREAGFKTEAFIQELNKNVGRVAFSSVRGLDFGKQSQFYASLPGVASMLDPSSTNWADPKKVETTFREILKDQLPNFTNSEVNAIAKELAAYAKKFNLVDPIVKDGAKDSGILLDYISDMFSENQVNQALRSFLNLNEAIAQGFENDVRIQRHRAIPLDYIRQFDNDPVRQRQAIIDVIQNKPMYAGAGKIGDGRYQVFENTNDFYKHLNTLPGIEIDIPNSRKSTQSWLKINGKEVAQSEITLIAETSAGGLKDKNFTGRLEQAKNARRYVKGMMELVVDGEYDNMDLAMLVKQMDSQMTAPLKRAANLEYIVPGLNPKNARYEHMIPTNFVLMNLVDYYKNDRANADTKADELFEEYKVAIIPKKMDDFLTKVGLQSKMNLGYKIGDPAFKRYYNIRTWGNKNFVAITSINPDATTKIIGESWEIAGKAVNKQNLFQELQQYRAETKAVELGSKVAFSAKGISVWDFDDTLAQTKSNVLYTLPDGTKGKIDATEFALQSAELESKGAKFDFSEFTKVMKGKKGPMFEKAVARNKKFGNENVFILTARPQGAANAIHTFLKGIDLDIRLENIVGLADGTAKAKADWMITKIADGYNDFYFADDAIKNVKAVKQIYDNFDIKGRVQLAKVAFSKGLSEDFNSMMERQKGVDPNKTFSEVVARRRGKKKGGFKFFIPPSAEDFRGLTQYTFAGKGKQGDADQTFFEDALMAPYFKGIAAIESSRQSIKNDTSGLLKMYKPVVKKLNKLIPGGDFTYDAAIRVYLWTEAGIEIPGISKRDQKKLHDLVKNDSDLSGYAAGLLTVSKVDVWPEPSKYWDTQTTLSDLQNLTDKVNRKQYLSEFIENVDTIFSEKNLFKIEALYGKATRSAIEDSIYAMKTGSNRTTGSNSINNSWLNWINNSVGTIMFFNRRSALLQLISSTNFINWSDNNVLQAGLAFANQPQYWKDFVMIFNSDKLKQRRGGLKSDVQSAEIANAAKNTKDKANAAISYLLKIGFTPTQIADSFAIASGGASFYRNRVKTYTKKGMSKADAEAAAFQDFSKVSDEAQQSGDPALVSQQQRSTAGRLILAFQNTPMQYTRLMKKAGQDIINGRGDFKTNFSKIIYYGAVQNLIFNALQQALFALIPGFDDDDTDESLEISQSRKQANILNGMMDSIIRGSGIYGAIATTLKNTIRKFYQQEKKGFTADHTYTIIEAANISPPVGSKLRKIYSAIQTYRFNKDVIAKHPWDLTIEGRYNPSPNYEIMGSLASALVNIPLDRVMIESRGIAEALDARNSSMQRIALALGWRSWGVGAENEEFDEIKEEAKAVRKAEGIEKGKQTRKDNKLKELLEYNAKTPEERAAIDAEKKRKRSESARKGAATRKENNRIKDSILTSDLIKLLQQ